MRLAMGPSALLSATLLGACVQSDPEGTARTVDLSEAQIIAAMQAKARDRAIAYPELTLSDVMFDRGRVIACGYLRSPGKKPLAFRSLDETPYDGDRLMPIFLGRAGAWDIPANAELSDNALERCASDGLVLPQPTLEDQVR